MSSRMSGSSQSDRASPRAATASSVVPYASVARSPLEIRPPNRSPVDPSSPVFV